MGAHHSRPQRSAAHAIGIFAALLLLACAAAPAQTAQERSAVLDRARTYALEYSQTLPDFICNESVRRFREGMEPNTWDLTDTLTVRLSYYGHKEDYKLLQVNGKTVNSRYDSLTGSITEGEFGSLLRQVFESDPTTEIRWVGWDTISGHRVATFTYRMTPDRAQYAINFVLNDRRYATIAGRRGTLSVVPEDGRILRVTSAADQLAADFPVQKLVSTLDYESTSIGDRSFVLPHLADVQMEAGTYKTRNTIEFQSYHKFNADADVSFDPESTPPKKK